MESKIKIKKIRCDEYKIYSNAAYNRVNIKLKGWIYTGKITYDHFFKTFKYKNKFMSNILMGEIFMKKISNILHDLNNNKN